MSFVEPPMERRPLGRRLAWFVGLWAASVGVLGLIAYGLRLWLNG